MHTRRRRCGRRDRARCKIAQSEWARRRREDTSVNAWLSGTQALDGLHNAMRVFADVDEHARADVSGEAVVIQMGMGDEHADQGVVSFREAGNRQQQIFV